jgi:hypothetical protein
MVKPGQLALLIRQGLGGAISAETLLEAPSGLGKRSVEFGSGELQILDQFRERDNRSGTVFEAGYLISFG